MEDWMALKQSRRTISFNRDVYDAIMAEAGKRGVAASAFVESLVRGAIPGLPESFHMTPEQIQRMRENRGEWTDPKRETHAARMREVAESIPESARRFVERRERQAQQALNREVQKLRRRWGIAP